MGQTSYVNIIATNSNSEKKNQINLSDLMVRRQAELAQLLAGCAALSPVAVIPALKRLNPDDLQDERARKYLAALRWRLVDLERADEVQCAEIVVKVAWDCGCAVDYLRWICLPDLPVEPVAEEAIRELQEMVISRRAIGNLQDYARSAENISRWGSYGNHNYTSQ